MKRLIADRNSKLEEAHVRSDNQVMQIRVILDKSEREHQREIDAETSKRDQFAGNFICYGLMLRHACTDKCFLSFD